MFKLLFYYSLLNHHLPQLSEELLNMQNFTFDKNDTLQIVFPIITKENKAQVFFNTTSKQYYVFKDINKVDWNKTVIVFSDENFSNKNLQFNYRFFIGKSYYKWGKMYVGLGNDLKKKKFQLKEGLSVHYD